LGLAERGEQVAGADLPGVGHQAEQAQSHRIAERRERAGEVLGVDG
jgi:hypothetical protein